MERVPRAIMSYTRFDDEHNGGHLTVFAERLSNEVRAYTGEDFSIFQDIKDIQWGEDYAARIEAVFSAVQFFIPIITPSFFRSVYCRQELQHFLKRADKLGRNDLILPVYYITTPELENPTRYTADPLVQALLQHQYVDWRELRFDSFDAPEWRRMLHAMARQIAKVLQREQVTATTASAAQVLPIGPELPTHIVDATQEGGFTTIGAAIQAAQPGERIRVRPGIYREGLVLDKAVEIVGESEDGEVIVEAVGQSALLFRANAGRVAGLTLRQGGGEGEWVAVNIVKGVLTLEDCTITSQSGACVAIHDNADPHLYCNHIYGGPGCGVYVYNNGKGRLEDNEIYDNAGAGVEIETGASPTLRRNRIYNNGEEGIYIHSLGAGTLEENEIYGNADAGLTVTTGGNPILRRNHIYDNKTNGAYISDDGQGTLEGNNIYGNTRVGVQIDTGSNPILRLNRIYSNQWNGVFVTENGQGVLEANDISGNGGAGVQIDTGGSPTLRLNRINKNLYQGVRVSERGGGVFETNDLRDNILGAWDVSPDSEINLQRSHNLEDPVGKEAMAGSLAG